MTQQAVNIRANACVQGNMFTRNRASCMHHAYFTNTSPRNLVSHDRSQQALFFSHCPMCMGIFSVSSAWASFRFQSFIRNTAGSFKTLHVTVYVCAEQQLLLPISKRKSCQLLPTGLPLPAAALPAWVWRQGHGCHLTCSSCTLWHTRTWQQTDTFMETWWQREFTMKLPNPEPKFWNFPEWFK